MRHIPSPMTLFIKINCFCLPLLLMTGLRPLNRNPQSICTSALRGVHGESALQTAITSLSPVLFAFSTPVEALELQNAEAKLAHKLFSSVVDEQTGRSGGRQLRADNDSKYSKSGTEENQLKLEAKKVKEELKNLKLDIQGNQRSTVARLLYAVVSGMLQSTVILWLGFAAWCLK